MKFSAKEVVRGATRFQDKIDGEEVKSAYVFVDVSLDQEGRGFGMRTEGKKTTVEVVDKIKHLPFPFQAEIFFEEIATRNKTQLVVVDVKPLGRVVEGKAAVPA